MPIYSATPKNISLGTKDESIRIPPPPQPNEAQLKPKFYIYAQKGPLTPEELDGPTALEMYGQDSFDKTSKYFNHATLFLKELLGAPATCVIERVFDPAQKVKANVTLWVDIALDDIPTYERNHDGSYVLDGSGQPVPTGDTVEGYKYRVYKSHVDNATVDPLLEGRDIYKEAAKQGFMTDKNSAPSMMYPIKTIIASSFGEAYNNEGFSIDPMTGYDAYDKLMKETKSFPYEFSRFSILSGVKTLVTDIFGDGKIKFTFKEDVLDPTTKLPLQIEEMIPEWYENIDNMENPVRYSDFDDPIMYYENIRTITTLIFEKEAPFVTVVPQTWNDTLDAATSEWFDFEANDTTALPEQELLMNLLTGVSSKEVNYFSYAKDTGSVVLTGNVNEVNISSSTTIYLNGGDDGQTQNLTNFETLVCAKYDEYLNIDAKVISIPLNPESIFIDSGFTVDTKIKMANVMAHRRDISVAYTTHEWNVDNKTFTIGEHRAIATLLKNKLKLMPESTYFGTSVARGIIVMGSGIKTDGSYRYRVPQLLDFIVKGARQMGAGNGQWKSGFNFSRSPLNVVDTIKYLEPTFIPETTKSILWKAGLIWTQNKDKRTWFYPSMQTVYDNDTSVLNSFTSIVAVTTIVKIHEDCWEEFSGATDLSNAELIEKVEEYMNKRLKDKWDGIVEAEPHCVITEDDKLRGYSWKLITYLYANNMKTVSESHIVAMRASDRNKS